MHSASSPSSTKDINKDFPLRGFVHCDDCGKPMTACWSKGCRRHYPYYLCDTRGCPSKRKSIPRSKIEGGFAEILRSLQPTHQFFELVRVMFKDAWDMRLKDAHTAKDAIAKQLKDVERQIEGLLDRVLDASNPSLVSAYESRITKLEREKILLTEKSEKIILPKGRFEEFIELSLSFLSISWNIYENSHLALKQTVLGLAFAKPLRYSRESGCRTPETTFPFKVLAGFPTKNVRWCGREDSNFHGCYPTATSTLRVYQFRHGRTPRLGEAGL